MIKEAIVAAMIVTPNPQLNCLTEAIYFEGRGESQLGQLAIANVVLNRVKSDKYPNDVCAVVHQRKQFSYFWDGKSERMRDRQAHIIAKNMATFALEGAKVGDVEDATHYHATYVKPSWMKKLKYITQIGIHRFYK